MKPQQSQELKTALYAAEQATKILLDYYKKQIENKITNKGRVDRVSQADLDSEKVIRDVLEDKFPKYSIVGEELGLKDKGSEFSWYIDPLCGSNDFIRGFSDFGLSIALVKGDEVLIGVCSLPAFSELYWAEKNSGAYLDDEKISVSKTPNLNDAIITTHFSAKGHDTRKPLSVLEKIAGFYIKIPGSFPYSVCSLACGKSDVHIETQVTGVHSLAARVIAEEAGGKATKIDGSTLSIQDDEVLITNGVLHSEAVRLLNS